MGPSFLQLQSPYLAAIIGAATPDATIASILKCDHDGAEALDPVPHLRPDVCRGLVHEIVDEKVAHQAHAVAVLRLDRVDVRDVRLERVDGRLSQLQPVLQERRHVAVAVGDEGQFQRGRRSPLAGQEGVTIARGGEHGAAVEGHVISPTTTTPSMLVRPACTGAKAL